MRLGQLYKCKYIEHDFLIVILQSNIICDNDLCYWLVVSCRSLIQQVNEFAHIQLEDLTVIKTLGVGGFGRVELVNLVISYNEKRKWNISRFYLGSFLVFFPINLLRFTSTRGKMGRNIIGKLRVKNKTKLYRKRQWKLINSKLNGTILVQLSPV